MSALYLDGPELATWIKQRADTTESVIGSTTARRIRGWESGEHAGLDTADRVLVNLGLHLCDVPDRLYLGQQEDETIVSRERRRRSDAKISDDQLRLLHRLHTERDLTIASLARRLWRGLEFSSASVAQVALTKGFKRLHLPARDRHEMRTIALLDGHNLCSERNRDGTACEQFRRQGSDKCATHADPERARRLAAKALAARYEKRAA